MLRVDIGIFAHNGAGRLAALIAAIAGQDVFAAGRTRARVLTLANGCTDGTAGVARTALAAVPGTGHAVHDLAAGGKSRTWNTRGGLLASDAHRRRRRDQRGAFFDVPHTPVGYGPARGPARRRGRPGLRGPDTRRAAARDAPGHVPPGFLWKRLTGIRHAGKRWPRRLAALALGLPFDVPFWYLAQVRMARVQGAGYW